jgi:hypothetical protein
MEGGVEPIAGAVAGEHPSGSVGAVRCGREADDREGCGRVAEAGDRSSPVVLATVATGRGLRLGLAPLDKPWAASAIGHLGGKIGELIGPG